jgi:hypothetical protein
LIREAKPFPGKSSQENKILVDSSTKGDFTTETQRHKVRLEDRYRIHYLESPPESDSFSGI